MKGTSKQHLVVIDDDHDLRDELTLFFGETYDVTAAAGHPGLLDQLRAQPPDILVLDVELAAVDGYEVLRLMTTAPELRHAPVIVLTALSDVGSLEKAHYLGAADYITKPFQPDHLRAKIEAAVAGRRHKSAGRRKLGALLVSSGLVAQDQLDAALVSQKESGIRLGDVLVRDGLVSESDLAEALAGQMRIGVVDLVQSSPSRAVIALLPRDFIIRHRVMPLQIDEKGRLVLAMTNPLDVIAIDEVSLRTKRRVQPVICTESGFDEAVSIFMSTRGKLKERGDEAEAEEELATAVDASIIEIVDSLIADAVSMSASDIHLEPRADTLHVRCRVDGVLHDLREFPAELQPGIISRLKIMGNMNIAERRLPQDGRTSFETSLGDSVDLRLASIPSQYGENITLRILEVSPLPPTLASLGLAGESLLRFERTLRRPEGGIVICGPTGCGKSTTLYTTLELIKSREKKIYTVEDPIERKLDGIVQTEARPAIGLTFAQALRALVRADPDVIMIGEIRDLETAKMAADSAITGHQVFTTMHTNDAPSAVNRLVEMGVPRYLVAAAFRCIVAQRLVRRLCRHCHQPETMPEARWRELGLGEAARRRVKVYRPVGCPKCFGTGYRGRVGLFEVLEIDDEIRDVIATGGTVGDIERLAREKNVESMREDGVRKILEGSTSYLELVRVAS